MGPLLPQPSARCPSLQLGGHITHASNLPKATNTFPAGAGGKVACQADATSLPWSGVWGWNNRQQGAIITFRGCSADGNSCQAMQRAPPLLQPSEYGWPGALWENPCSLKQTEALWSVPFGPQKSQEGTFSRVADQPRDRGRDRGHVKMVLTFSLNSRPLWLRIKTGLLARAALFCPAEQYRERCSQWEIVLPSFSCIRGGGYIKKKREKGKGRRTNCLLGLLWRAGARAGRSCSPLGARRLFRTEDKASPSRDWFPSLSPSGPA